MNDREKFAFYNNYYMLIKLLKKEDRKMMALCILEYMFEDKEPDGLNEECEYAWSNLVKALEKSIKQTDKVKKRWSEENTKNDTECYTEVDTKSDTKKDTVVHTNNISIFLFLISNFNLINKSNNLKNKIEEWLKYKQERKENYKQIGLNSLLKQIETNVTKYGENHVINLIDECMASNYKGIIFDKLKGKKKEPNWLNKEIESEIMTDEEIAELERKMNWNKEVGN